MLDRRHSGCGLARRGRVAPASIGDPDLVSADDLTTVDGGEEITTIGDNEEITTIEE